MATVKITYYYDRIGLDCQTDGDVCERGYYVPGGWHYGEHSCPTCNKDSGPFPATPEDIAACECECEARDVVEDVSQTIGGIDSAQVSGDRIMVYGVDSCADFDDNFHEYRQAAIVGDIRLLRIIAKQLSSR